MKLLLVDDEEYVIESIKRNLDLTETGVSEVYTAFSVQQAKNIMGMVDIDIVISDIVMPGGTGFDFVEWIREEELKVQVIFLTSYAEFDYARRAIQLNSVDYLLKPKRQVTYMRKEHAYFGRQLSYKLEIPDMITEKLYQPLQKHFVSVSNFLRRLQQGSVRLYVAYVMVAMMLVLVWGALYK